MTYLFVVVFSAFYLLSLSFTDVIIYNIIHYWLRERVLLNVLVTVNACVNRTGLL